MQDDVFTLLANVEYQANRWLPYVYDRKLATSPLMASGLINVDSKLAEHSKSIGRTFTVPYFNPLSGLDQLLTSNSRVAVSNIDTSKMNGTRNIRWTAWGWEDLAQAITAADPARAIGDQAATWENNADMGAVGALLTGLFAAGGALRTTAHYSNIAVEIAANVNAGTKFSGAALVTALQAGLGDAEGQISVLAINSGVYLQMRLANLIQSVTFQLPSGVDVKIETYLGKYKLIVNDSIAPRRLGTGAGTPFVYRTYAFAPGAIGYGSGLPPGLTAFESERIVREKKNVSVYTRGFVVHPYGLSWTGAVCADEWPTNDEYATPANWVIAPTFAAKDIPIIALDTN